MRRAVWVPVLAVAVLLGGVSARAWADSSANDAFGAVRVASLEQAKARAMAWLKGVNADPATLQKAEAIWAAGSDMPVLDRVVETFMLVDLEAGELIKSARDPEAPAPTAVPHLFVDSTKPMFFRANLGLYFAKLIGQRKVYPECLATLKAFAAEDTVDPATYYFFKAVAANKLRFKDEGLAAIKNLGQVEGAPERYTVVGNLMAAEMQQWKDQDLGDIARRMKEVEDRLDIARGGSVTRVKQDEIVDLLAKMIKALEEQC